MSAVDWRDAKYDEVFRSTLRGLEKRRRNDAEFALGDAEGVLKHLYIQDGNDWIGRGELQDQILAATIAAYEQLVTDWKAGRLPPSEEESPCP